MYNETVKKQSEPRGLKKFAAALVFMVIGAAVAGVGSSYYWQTQCRDQYNLGKVDGRNEGIKQTQQQQEQNLQARIGDGPLSKRS